jgi:hypothetical protein
MSSEYFRIDEHILDASHIRGFPRTTSTHQNEVLQLAIKQYTPLDNLRPQPGDITIISAHANAFPKVYFSTSCTYYRLSSNILSLQQLLYCSSCIYYETPYARPTYTKAEH